MSLAIVFDWLMKNPTDIAVSLRDLLIIVLRERVGRVFI